MVDVDPAVDHRDGTSLTGEALKVQGGGTDRRRALVEQQPEILAGGPNRLDRSRRLQRGEALDGDLGRHQIDFRQHAGGLDPLVLEVEERCDGRRIAGDAQVDQIDDHRDGLVRDGLDRDALGGGRPRELVAFLRSGRADRGAEHREQHHGHDDRTSRETTHVIPSASATRI